ncbi:MAG: FAD:protein FMN transferase [Chitinophagaceae bacterium]|nr:FAD:protein FMN transferase [Chitinophagaceae bacterium]
MKGLLYIILLIFIGGSRQDLKSVVLSGHAQGTTWNVTYFNDDSTVLKNSIDSIFDSIDSSLSIYKPYSIITAFNKSEKGVKADGHVVNVVNFSTYFAKETQGLADITVGPLTQAWGFGTSHPDSMPGDQQIEKLRACVGFKNIGISNDSLIKRKPCVKIDVNGIAQGYTVDVIADYLEAKGIKDYLIEVGGELRSKGRKPGSKPFQVGIESPSDNDFDISPFQQIISLEDGAITTSGNYRKYFESKGRRFSHIIDPRTGRSVNNEMISVTVYAAKATYADALDNAFMVMGVKDALKYVEEKRGLAAYIIYKDENGNIKDTASTRFRQLVVHR